MRQLKAIVMAFVLTAVCVVQTHAGTIDTYTNRDDWDAAVGTSVTYTEDFSSIGTDTEFRTVPVNLGRFTMEETGSGSPSDPEYGFNLIDVDPFNSTLARMAVMPTNKIDVEMTFDVPVSAFGADFLSALSASMLDLVLLDAGGEFATIEMGVGDGFSGDGFFGFVTSDPDMAIEKIIFKARLDTSALEVFSMGNVSAAIFVPEPSSVIGLLGICVTGLLGLGFVRRRSA